MEDSPSKRRKVSPFTSINISTSNTSKKPMSQDGQRAPPIRASLMSPTKASLSRFYPNLLLPSILAENKSQAVNDGHEHASKAEQQSELGMENKVVNGGSQISQANGESCPEMPVPSLRDSTERMNAQLSEPTPASLGDELSKNLRVVSTLETEPFFSKETQVPMVQDLRASSPPAAKDIERTASPTQNLRSEQKAQESVEEERINGENKPDTERMEDQEHVLPFTPRKHPDEAPEPRLPSTPTQLGLEAPLSPPRGLTLNSPSRRPRRKRRGDLRPSPLKPDDQRNAEAIVEKLAVSTLGPRIPVDKIRSLTFIGGTGQKNNTNIQ